MTRYVLLFNAFIDARRLACEAAGLLWDTLDPDHMTDLRRMCFVTGVLEGLLIEETLAAGSAADDDLVAGIDG